MTPASASGWAACSSSARPPPSINTDSRLIFQIALSGVKLPAPLMPTRIGPIAADSPAYP